MIVFSDTGFLATHTQLIHPRLMSHKLPASVDFTFFHKNEQPPVDPVLPHLLYGGELTISRLMETKFLAGDYCLYLYVNSGKVRIAAHGESATCDPHSAILTGFDQEVVVQTLTKHVDVALYLVQGEAIAGYQRGLAKLYGDHAFYAMSCPYAPLVEKGFVAINDCLLSGTTFAMYRASSLIQMALTALLSEDETKEEALREVPPHVLQLKQILDLRYGEPITLDSLEQELKMSKYRLCRDFSQHMGVPPLHYLNQKRIERARELLLSTDDTVVSIGNTVGIPGTTHFINLFKRETGHTPLQYRRFYLP